jgi:hypothetical protein
VFVLRTLCTDPLEGAFTSPFRLTGAVSVTLARRENVPGCMDQPKEAESSLLLPSDDGDNDDDESESDGGEFDDDGDDDGDDDFDDEEESSSSSLLLLTHGTSILMNSDRVHTSVTFSTLNNGLNNPKS